jgi:hypothetical protein
MSVEDLKKYRRGLVMLSESHVEAKFRQMLADCLSRPGLPEPYKMQQMLTTWKVLWTWQQRSPR